MTQSQMIYTQLSLKNSLNPVGLRTKSLPKSLCPSFYHYRAYTTHPVITATRGIHTGLPL